MSWTPMVSNQAQPERTRAIHRYEVPVDDTWHSVVLSGGVVHVACRSVAVVELWAFAGDYGPVTLELRVFGTGQPLPAGYGGASLRYVGTAVAPPGGLVWHLLQRMAGAGEADPR